MDDFERKIFLQIIGDAKGYPKSQENKKQIGFSYQELSRLYKEILSNPNKELNTQEKQAILNSIDGALDYVNTDIPSLYNISEEELQSFKTKLEEQWRIKSTYKRS